MKRFGSGALVAVLAVLAGCASPPYVLKEVVTGGDAHPRATVSPTGQVDMNGINIGDTVVFAPGSMRAVVPSPQVRVIVTEPGFTTEAEMKKQLQLNRREGAKIEVMKGHLFRGDFFQQTIVIDLEDKNPKKWDVDLTLLAFNRGERAFRGDLTIWDAPPPELEFLGADTPAKYNDRRGLKEGLSVIPFLGMITLGMDNFARSNETLDVVTERSGGSHKYTFRRLVLEPGQAVGFVLRHRMKPPTAEELNDMRQEARPMPQGRH